MIFGVKIPVDLRVGLDVDRADRSEDSVVMVLYSYKTVLPLGSPERGDIIVFMFPEDETKDFIKRTIRLPGDVLGAEQAGVDRGHSFRAIHSTLIRPLCRIDSTAG